MERLLHPIDQELGTAAYEALELEPAEHRNDLGVEQGDETGTDRGERCHELPHPQNEQRSMRVESERIRDVKGQDICEMVQNNREAVALPIQENLDWTCEQCNTSIILVENFNYL
jgi:hypothetical protein